MRCPPLGDKCPNEVGWENVSIAKYAVTSNIAHRRFPAAHLELRRAMLCGGRSSPNSSWALEPSIPLHKWKFYQFAICTRLYSAVQPPGLSYTAHWEALGCAFCLLTTPKISSTAPVLGRGFCPGSHRPCARVPLVVWAWDFVLCGFFAAVSRPLLSHPFSLCDL